MEGKMEAVRALGIALGVYLLWVLATWLLEGMRFTLNRPEATVDRLLCTLVANILGTILFLTAIGVATSLVCFAWEEVYTTIAFHNFFGSLGVMQALAAGGLLGIYASPRYPVLVLALVSVAVLIVADLTLVRKRTGSRVG